MNSLLSPRVMVGAAIVGIVGAAGVFIYEQIYAEKRRSMLIREVARLDKQVTSMRSELEALRELQKETQLRRLKQKKPRREKPRKAPPPSHGDNTDAPDQSYASDSEYFTDYQSIIGTDGEMDSEEFYDVHTDEDEDEEEPAPGAGALRDLDPLTNGHATPAKKLDEDISDKADVPISSQNNST